MGILIENIFWMTGNTLLAVIAVCAGWLTFKVNGWKFKMLFGFLWLLFIPNTIYMLSDSIHLPMQFFSVNGIVFKIILFLQYVLLIIASVVTFVGGVYPVEMVLQKELKQIRQYKRSSLSIVLVLVNFIIAFGVTIGRIQRTNSWEVFTNIGKVIKDSMNVFTSRELLFLVLFFGILNNLLYFSLRSKIKKMVT